MQTNARVLLPLGNTLKINKLDCVFKIKYTLRTVVFVLVNVHLSYDDVLLRTIGGVFKLVIGHKKINNQGFK